MQEAQEQPQQKQEQNAELLPPAPQPQSHFAYMKAVAGLASFLYALVQVAQIVGMAIYIYNSFGYYYYPTGIVVNSVLCTIRFLTPYFIISVCTHPKAESAGRKKSCICYILVLTLLCVVGGFACDLVLHGKVSAQKGNDGMCVIYVLIALAIDTVMYCGVSLAGYKLVRAIQDDPAAAEAERVRLEQEEENREENVEAVS